jgi:hypothetical protein
MKMPNDLKIWIETRTGEENSRDLTTILQVGDEIGLTTGKIRNRTTMYKVRELFVNCAHLKREDVILAEKRQELKEKLGKDLKDPSKADDIVDSAKPEDILEAMRDDEDAHQENLEEEESRQEETVRTRAGVVEIHDGKAPGFCCMAWSGDLKKYGVSIQQLYNPATKWIGLQFSKNGQKKSVVFGEGSSMETVAPAMREVEEFFGIPAEASKYVSAVPPRTF